MLPVLSLYHDYFYCHYYFHIFVIQFLFHYLCFLFAYLFVSIYISQLLSMSVSDTMNNDVKLSYLQMCRCKESLEEVARIAELICLHHSGFLPSTSTYLNGKLTYVYTYCLACLRLSKVLSNNVVIIFTLIFISTQSIFVLMYQ